MALIFVRAMTPQDIPTVSALVCTSFRWGAQREGLPADLIQSYFSARGSTHAIRKQRQRYQCLVAISGQTIAGMVAVRGGEITKLYVDPTFHGQGVGRRLFQEAEKKIAQAGYAFVTLGTIFPATILFYKKLGMSVTDQRAVEYGPAVGAIVTLLIKSCAVSGKEKSRSPELSIKSPLSARPEIQLENGE